MAVDLAILSDAWCRMGLVAHHSRISRPVCSSRAQVAEAKDVPNSGSKRFFKGLDRDRGWRMIGAPYPPRRNTILTWGLSVLLLDPLHLIDDFV